mmetsp:Transcript_72114/g.203733  ORF Transcript_72114/g.203733 Transcript_72114/m.203733 type:complete len:207 (-) Transcript_72114:68-688(-)
MSPMRSHVSRVKLPQPGNGQAVEWISGRARRAVPSSAGTVPSSSEWQPGSGTYTDHLSGLEKVGKGASSFWLVGRYCEGQGDGEISFDVGLRPDRNSQSNCLNFVFLAADGKKMGYLLVENQGPQSSALRGMALSKELRGRGLSKLLLAVWLHVCSAVGARPRTNRIDKPLISLLLRRFGFVPGPNAVELEAPSKAGSACTRRRPP